MDRIKSHLILAGSVFAVCGMFLLPAAPTNAADPLTPDQKKAFEKVIRDYLLNKPEIILESMEKLRDRERILQEKAAVEKLASSKATLFKHPMTPMSGSKNADVTLVEFFDYQCGYCKRVIGSMVSLVENDKNLRVVWKELPILGPNSRYAATAAMAAKKQGKYFLFHVALMKSRGQLSPEGIIRTARKIGLDVKKLQEDMGDPEINAYLDETIQLAQSLGIRGTPGFIIGKRIIPGAVGLDQLKSYIAEERKPKS
jgi:protein-disulfide isomerase